MNATNLGMCRGLGLGAGIGIGIGEAIAIAIAISGIIGPNISTLGAGV